MRIFFIWQQEVLATVKGFQLVKLLEGRDIGIPPSHKDVLNNKVNQEFLNY